VQRQDLKINIQVLHLSDRVVKLNFFQISLQSYY
jgi:hypothetical protein